MRGHILTAILAIAVPDVAMAAEVPVLLPSSPWNIYSTKDRCVLARDYGTGEDAVTMAFRPLPLSDLAEMRLITNTKKAGYVEGKGTILLRPGPIEVKGYSRGGKPGENLRRTTTMSLSLEAMKALPQSTEVEMTVSGERIVRVKLTKIAAALDALTACNDAITTQWGVDVAEQARVVTRAARTSGPLVTGDDYPATAVRTVAEADTTAIWRIGPDKQVSGCKVIGGNDPLFDDAVCRAIQARARYTNAALDAEGKPIASYSSVNVRWRLPELYSSGLIPTLNPNPPERPMIGVPSYPF